MLKVKRVQIDPRTKILFCILINIVIYSYIEKTYLMLFIGFAFVLLFYYSEYRTIKTYVLIYTVMTAFHILTPYIPRLIVRLLTPTIVGLEMFFPFILYGTLLVKTSKISDVVNVLDKMYCPNVLIIPFLVLLRFFPTIHQEVVHISNAMKLRGLNFGLRSLFTKPVKTIEYLYVPLLYSMVKSGNELTVASLTRGLGGEKRRTYNHEVRFHLIDLLLILLFVLLMIVSFVFGKGV